jgi:hypothetical protein
LLDLGPNPAPTRNVVVDCAKTATVLELGACPVEDLTELYRPGAELDAVAVELRRGAEIPDQPAKPPGGAFDAGGEVAHVLGSQRATVLGHGHREALDRCDRSEELVRQHLDQLALHPVELP